MKIRSTFKKKNKTNKGGIIGGAGYLLGSGAAGIAGVGEGIIDLGVALGADLSGNHKFAEYVFKDNVVGDWHADITEDYNPDKVMQFGGDVAHGLGQSSWFLLSLIPGAQWLGPTVFGTGMVGQGISSAADKTGDVGIKEAAYGVTTAALETGLETALGGMGSIAKSGVKAAAKKTGKQAIKSIATSAARKGLASKLFSAAAGEFAEEFVSEYADTFLQRAYQIDPSAEYSLQNALYAGAVGAVSGGISAGPVNITNTVTNRARGAKIIRNGNAQTVVNTANYVADKLAASGTDFKNAPEWVKTLRGEVDAYKKLADKGQENSASAETILGEMQASLYFAETQAIHNGIVKRITEADENSRAAMAEYINQNIDKSKRKRDYTAEDVAANTDDIAKQLGIMNMAGATFFNFEGAMADMAQESAIESVVEQERAKAAQNAESGAMGEAEAAPVNDEAFAAAEARAAQSTSTAEAGEIKHDLADDVADIEASAKIIDDDIKRIRKDVKSAVSNIKVDGKLYELTDKHVNNIANGVQKYMRQGMSESDAIALAVKNRLRDIKSMGEDSGVKHELGKATLTKVRSAVINAYRSELQSRTVDNASKTAQEAQKATEGTEGQKSGENVAEGERTRIRSTLKKKSSERKNESTESGEPKISEAKEALTDEQRAERAKKQADKWIEWEKKTAPTAKELNTAREYVKGFDNLNNTRRLAIIRMIRSSENVDAQTVKGIANLMAVIPDSDLEVRFSDGIGHKGLITKIGNKSVIVIDSSADRKTTIKGTIAHELTHYLENKAGYEQLAKYVREHAKPEVIEKHKNRYINGWAKIGYKYTEAELDSEITASLVADALNNERFLKRYADRDKKLIQKAFEWLKGLSTRSKKKGKETEDISEITDEMAHKLIVLLQSDKTTGESKSGVKYSFSSIADSNKLRINELLQQIANGEERDKYRKLMDEGKMTIAELGKVIKDKRDAVVAEVVGENVNKSDETTVVISQNIYDVKNMASVSNITGNEFQKGTVDLITQVTAFFDSVGHEIENDELGKVTVDKRGIKDDIAHGLGRKKAASFAAVPDVIKSGKVVDYQTNWKNRGYDTAVLAAPIEIGGKRHYMGIVLIRGQNDQSFYVHEVLSIEEGAVPFKTGTVNTNGNTGGNTPFVFSILQKIIDVNNFDENKSDISAITVKKYDLADEDADGNAEKKVKKKAKTKAEVVAENKELRAENKELKANQQATQNKMRGMLEKLAREEAEYQKLANAEVFAKEDVALAVKSIESWTQEEALSLAKGFDLKGMNKARREDMISQIYIALHEQSARGQSGPGSVAVKAFATEITSEYIDSAQIVGEDGKSYHFADIYDETSVNGFKQELADLLYGEFSNMGRATANAEFLQKIRVMNESFRRERLNEAMLSKDAKNVAYQAKEIKKLAETQKRDGVTESLGKLTNVLGSIVDAKGSIRVGVIDKAMGEISAFLEGEKFKIDSERGQLSDKAKVSEIADVVDEELQFMVEEFRRLRSGREGKSLSAEEMKLAGNILRGMKTSIERYNKEYINGHWVDIDAAASGEVEDLISMKKLMDGKEYKTKVGEILGEKVGKGANEFYFYKILSPENVLSALESYREGGLLQSMYHSVRVARQKAGHLAVQMKKPFAEFLDDKENRWEGSEEQGGKSGKQYSYRDKLNVRKINVNGAELTLGEAIYLLMLTKRKESHAGLMENGYIVYDENNQKRLKVKLTDIDRARDLIYSQLDGTDRKFLQMAEEFFNKTSSRVKHDADMKIFGYSNIIDGYYVPMIRDRYSRMQGVTDARQGVMSIVTVYNKSFNQNLIANAKALEGKNIMSIINDHADGLAEYSEMYLPLKAFDRVYNKAVAASDGEVRSIREVLNNDIWNGTEQYLKDLFRDVQGQREKRDNVVDAIVGKLRAGWVNSVLGANIKVVATQTTSLGAATQIIEPRYITKAASVIAKKDISELRERAYKYSDIIEARGFDMGALKAQGNIDKVSKLGEKSGFLIGWMDERVCLEIFHAAEIKVEELTGEAIGTEKNAEKAAKIADEAIYTTQAMSDATERSALQRSTSEIAKLFSMFTSDSVKNLSHLWGNLMKYQAHKARADAGDAKYAEMLKQDKAELGRSVRTLAITGIMLGLITQAFKYLYAKEEEEPEDKAKDFAIDIISSTLNILPIVSDIVDKLFLDYDISMNVLDVANDTIETVGKGGKLAGKAMSGEYVSTKDAAGATLDIVMSGAQLFGIPVKPVERTVTGLMRRFVPSTIYGYDAMFSNPSYTADLKKAVESGDDVLAEYVLDQLYKSEVSGTYTSVELEEVARLYSLTDDEGKHYSVLPQKIGTEVNGVKLSSAQRKKFMSIYSGASNEVTKLIGSSYYTALTDEQRAKAIRNIYSMYYDRAAAEVAGKEWSNAVAYSYLTSNYTALFAAQAYKNGLTEQKDASGKKITVGEQFVEYAKNLGLSESDYVVITYANGVKNKSNRAALIAYINSLSLSTEIKAQIAERLGFEVKDGVIVEKTEQ